MTDGSWITGVDVFRRLVAVPFDGAFCVRPLVC